MPKHKIVLVEDEPMIAAMVKSRLEANGYDVVVAADGMEGLQKIRKEAPDLIMLDVMLPRVNGYEICAMVKANSRYGKTPIIMLTACARDSDKTKGQQAGADAYITKPFDAKKLLTTIKKLIEANDRKTNNRLTGNRQPAN